MADNLWSVTLNLPAHCRSMRETGKLLHKWRMYLQSHGNISFKGGIFQQLDETGNLKFHIHLIVKTNIDRKKLRNEWIKISKLTPTSSPCYVKEIDDDEAWERYIYVKNVKESVSYKIVIYLEQLLKTKT